MFWKLICNFPHLTGLAVAAELEHERQHIHGIKQANFLASGICAIVFENRDVAKWDDREDVTRRVRSRDVWRRLRGDVAEQNYTDSGCVKARRKLEVYSTCKRLGDQTREHASGRAKGGAVGRGELGEFQSSRRHTCLSEYSFEITKESYKVAKIKSDRYYLNPVPWISSSAWFGWFGSILVVRRKHKEPRELLQLVGSKACCMLPRATARRSYWANDISHHRA